MTDDQILEEFRAAQALLEGHFILSSGRHSPRYLQCARVLMDPRRGARLAEALAARLPAELRARIEVVVSPAMGGVIAGHEMARALGVEAMFLERPTGSFELRRGFRLDPGAQVLMMEDVVTTGLSSREAIAAIAAAGGDVIAAAALVDRSNGAAAFEVPFVPLIRLDVPSYAAHEVPPALAATPAIKPGEPGSVMLLAAMLALLAPAQAVDPRVQTIDGDRIGAVIDAAKLEGDVVVTDLSPGAPRYYHVGLLPEAYRGGDHGLAWRWASVTKQVVAVLIMQEVAAGRIALDAPVARYLPRFRSANAARITIRQLLQHRSGLPNPDDTAASADAFPAFYLKGYTGNRDPLTGYCAGPVKGEPGGNWAYNNCDYLVLGAVLKATSGESWTTLVAKRIAKPLGLKTLRAYPGERHTRFGTIGGVREPAIDLASYGAAAGLYGSPKDLVAFDVALMTGKLLPADALATLWEGDPKLGYMALGQWAFSAPLRGCAAPVRIIERRGAIGGVELRNFILPERGLAIAAFSQVTPFDFGEVWQGKGFSHDLLAAVACA